jgi:hypothetical protein
VIRLHGDAREETFLSVDETILADPRQQPEMLVRYRGRIKSPDNGSAAMLAEKFLLVVESLIRTQGQTQSDGSTRVVSTSPHVPVQLPARSGK